jgi:hypothetical protein
MRTRRERPGLIPLRGKGRERPYTVLPADKNVCPTVVRNSFCPAVVKDSFYAAVLRNAGQLSSAFIFAP